MRARVTNRSRAPRGVQTTAGGTVVLEPGAAADLDLADHPAHDAWVKAGEVEIRPEPEVDEAPPVRVRGSTRRGRDA